MVVTEVVIRKLVSDGKKRAIVSITLDDGLAVHGLSVVETDHVFVSFPSEQDTNGKRRDIVHPIDRKTRVLIENAVLTEYAKVKEER